VDHQHVRHVRDHRDRHEVLLVVVIQLEDVRRDRLRAVRRNEQRVAVGRRFRNELGTDVAAGPRPVLDQHALRQHRGEALGKEPGDDVVAARARGIGHDEPHGFYGVFLPGGGGGCCERQQQAYGQS
jgi:hypothetical protein